MYHTFVQTCLTYLTNLHPTTRLKTIYALAGRGETGDRLVKVCYGNQSTCPLRGEKRGGQPVRSALVSSLVAHLECRGVHVTATLASLREGRAQQRQEPVTVVQMCGSTTFRAAGSASECVLYTLFAPQSILQCKGVLFTHM